MFVLIIKLFQSTIYAGLNQWLISIVLAGLEAY